jgi:hypothetical protein
MQAVNRGPGYGDTVRTSGPQLFGLIFMCIDYVFVGGVSRGGVEGTDAEGRTREEAVFGELGLQN